MEAAATPLPLQALASQLFGRALAVPVEKAAEALSCSRSQVYSMLERGQLAGVALSEGKRSGKRVGVLSLLSFITNGGVEQPDKPTPAARLAADERARTRSSDYL